MDVGLLYSGGKDSTLAGLLLDDLSTITALCCTFGITDDVEHARAAAEAVGFPSRTVELDADVAHEAAERIVADGFPRHGIQQVHEHALERVATLSFDGIADGTRRDDRVPTVDRPLAQSIEDRHDVNYLAPLAGIGREAIDRLVSQELEVTTGPSEDVQKGDYEAELRALVAAEYDDATVADVFPAHTQSRVLGVSE